MARVKTVAGDIEASELGFTLPHEHLVFGMTGWELDVFPHADKEARYKTCLKHMKASREAGVQALVECSTPEMGRDVELMRELSEATGMHIVASTGLYARRPAGYWMRRTPEEIAELFVHELEKGVRDTGIRCGQIKTALEGVELTGYEEMVLRAAAMAHKATGAPIMIHVEEEGGMAALELLTAEGVPGSRIVIAHAETTADMRYLLRILEGYGAYVGFDRFGLDLTQRDDVRHAMVAALCIMGFANRIQISHDFPCFMHGRDIDRWKDTPDKVRNWNFVYVPTEVVPRLREAGVKEADIRQMTVGNAAELYAS
jgi:phosphotriesterase-related protein